MNQSPALHFYYADHARAFSSVGMWDNSTETVTGLAGARDVVWAVNPNLPLARVATLEALASRSMARSFCRVAL